MMNKTALFCILYSISSYCLAGSLYKCPKADGRMEFRGSPCPNHQSVKKLNPTTLRPWRGMMLDLSESEILQIYALKKCHTTPKEKTLTYNPSYHPKVEKKVFEDATKVFLTKKWADLTSYKLNQILKYYRTQAPSFERTNERKINQLAKDCIVAIKKEKIALVKESPDLLVAAASNGFLEKVKRILKRGVDVDYTSGKDYYQNTALIGAAKRNQYAVVKLLLAKGANPNKRNLLSATPLLEASKAGAGKQVITELIYYGAKVDYINPRDPFRRPMLYWAVYSGNPETVHVLLNKDANPNHCFTSPKTKKRQSVLGYLETIKNKKFRIKTGLYLKAFKAKKECA